MTDNILDICDVRHTHVNVCVYVSHIGSSTICCWPVMHRTMWAPVHIVAYSFSLSLWSSMQNFEPNTSTADRLLCALYLQSLTYTMQVRCGTPIYSAQAHGPTAGAQQSPPNPSSGPHTWGNPSYHTPLITQRQREVEVSAMTAKSPTSNKDSNV